jgi:acyl-CoA synthetase (AMP-forming)/AMP-acid ligase II
MKAGLVAVPLNYCYALPEIDHTLEVSEASILLAHAEALWRARGQQGRGAPPSLKAAATANPPWSAVTHSFEAIRRMFVSTAAPFELTSRDVMLIKASPATSELPRHGPADPAFIFFTSGSTGPAKASRSVCTASCR